MGVPLTLKDHEKRSGLPQSLATFAVAGSKWSNGSEVMAVFLTFRVYANISRFWADENVIFIGMVDKVTWSMNLRGLGHCIKIWLDMNRENLQKFEYSTFSIFTHWSLVRNKISLQFSDSAEKDK